MARSQMTFGVTIASYWRPDGSTLGLLQRAIDSLLAQTYSHWKLYLVGDRYKRSDELARAVEKVDPAKLFVCNLPYATERDSELTGRELWYCGGAGAMNFALTLQHLEQVDVHAHLDDDDVWLPEHLETLVQGYRQSERIAFVFTRAQYVQPGRFHPDYAAGATMVSRLPGPAGLIHSAASWRLSQITTMYVPRRDYPTDADLWRRVAGELQAKGLESLYVPTVTVVKESELRLVKRCATLLSHV